MMHQDDTCTLIIDIVLAGKADVFHKNNGSALIVAWQLERGQDSSVATYSK